MISSKTQNSYLQQYGLTYRKKWKQMRKIAKKQTATPRIATTKNKSVYSEVIP